MMRRPPLLVGLLLAVRFRREAREIILGDLDEEFRELVSSGVSEQTARRHYAMQALASIFAVSWPTQSWHRGLTGDVRYALRTLRKSPGFVGVAALSLGLGIGANTALFSMVRALVLDSLPVERPGDLRVIVWHQPRKDARIPDTNSTGFADPTTGRGYRSNYTLPEYHALRSAASDDAEVFAFNFVRQVNVAVSGAPPIVASAVLVSGNFFHGLRVPLVAGRALDAKDDRVDAPLVTVISSALWHRVFGGDPRIIGQVVRINGQPVEVVGVTHAAFHGLSRGGFFPRTDLLVPLSALRTVAPSWTPGGRSLLVDTEWHWLRLMARVSSRTDEHRVASRLGPILGQQLLAAGTLEPADAAATEVRLLDGRRGPEPIRRDLEHTLRIVSGVSAVGLLLACVNLAGLTFARGVARERELAMRRALGAGRFRLIRQLVIENVLVTVAGGAVGLALAQWAGPSMSTLLTTTMFGPLLVDFSIDWRVVLAMGVLCGIATLSFGLVPAVRLSRGDTLDFKQGGVGDTIRSRNVGRWLLALQIAISVPLVVSAGLLLQTVHNFSSTNLGFDPANLAVFRVDPTIGKPVASGDDNARLYQQLLAQLEALPGVQSATVLENLLAGGTTSGTTVTIDGARQSMRMNAVGPRFFETMRIRLLAGREFDHRDTYTAPGVVIVNEAAARRFFGGAALGMRFLIGRRDVEIVGVVADTKYHNLRTDLIPIFFDSYLQRGARPGSFRVAVRHAGAAGPMESAIRQAVARVQADVAVLDFQSQTEAIDSTISKERALTRLLVLFGGLALLLASIGLYGATVQNVSRRTNEIGVRVALGANRFQVAWLILRQVIVVAAAGLAVGLPVAVAAGPLVQSLLYGVGPTDVTTLILSSVIMLCVATIAGWLPARRAARMDPLVALRRE